VKDLLGRADNAIELFVRHFECFLDPFHKNLFDKNGETILKPVEK
jgi:hypothetical protein